MPYIEAELVPGSIRGERQWRVSATGQLRAVALTPTSFSRTPGWHTDNLAWRDGVNVALCGRGHEHPAPTPMCHCGYYAYYAETDVRSFYGSSDSLAFGVIEGWGRAELCSLGFRVQKAKILGVVLPETYSFQPPRTWQTRLIWALIVLMTTSIFAIAGYSAAVLIFMFGFLSFYWCLSLWPRFVRRMVRLRYPSVIIFDSRDDLLDQFPASRHH